MLDILREVKARGDEAIIEYSQRFDGHSLSEDSYWIITAERCREAYDALEPDLREALELGASAACEDAPMPIDPAVVV